MTPTAAAWQQFVSRCRRSLSASAVPCCSGGGQKGAYQPKDLIIPLLGFLFLLNEIATTTVVSTLYRYGRSRVLSDAVQLS